MQESFRWWQNSIRYSFPLPPPTVGSRSPPLPLPTNKTVKCLSSLPILMQKSFWWWQCSVAYSSRFLRSPCSPVPLGSLCSPVPTPCSPLSLLDLHARHYLSGISMPASTSGISMLVSTSGITMLTTTSLGSPCPPLPLWSPSSPVPL